MSGLIDLDNSGTNERAVNGADPVQFNGDYIGTMEMYAPRQMVADYLDVHQDWFRRCAHPMNADVIGENSYALLIGRYGAFGYEVEPKVGLELLPQDKGIYRIETVPVPGYEVTGYDVDFQAALQLMESNGEEGDVLTRVEWQLQLTVWIEFPRFIHALPMHLIKASGDKLLNQIVRQVSRRLTRKVQHDFHGSRNISFPQPGSRRYPWQFSRKEN